MERARLRKSKSASGIEGIQQFQKQNAGPRLSSDSRCYVAERTRDMLMPDLEQSSFKRTDGTPIKKLLAEEMSKEVEPRRRPPSVIARLMGLEGLPSPRHVCRQQKRPDCHQHKNVSIEIQPNSHIYDVQSNRRRSMEQQEFKDVYEDLEASHVMNRRCSSRWSASSIITKPEMALIHQKFIDAKRLSADENIQDSKELDDTLELLDCNKDLLLKLFGKPDTLFLKHLHDVQANRATSVGSRIAVLKPSNSFKSEGEPQVWKAERESSRKCEIASHLKRKDGLLLESHHHHRAHRSRRSPKIPLEDKNEEKIHPTRIVVLKPNLSKTRTVGTSGSSTNHSHVYQPNFQKMKEHSSDVGSEMVSCRRNDASCRVGLGKPMCTEAREIARNITRRMKDGFDDGLDVKSACGFRGYAGDESSYDDSESDSDSDLDVFKLSSRVSFSDNKLYRCSSSSSVESSVYREGKKRLSERCGMAQRYQDFEMVGKGSTLGEMLALPDRELRNKDFDNKICLGTASSRLNSINGNSFWDGSSGISGRQSRKDEIERTSRFRSKLLLPPIDGRRQRRSAYRDESSDDNHMVHSNPIRRGRNKVAKENLSQKEDFSINASISGSRTPQPCQHIFINENVSSVEANFQNQMKERVKDLSEQQPIVQMDAKALTRDGHVHDITVAAGLGSKTSLLKSSVLLSEQLSSVGEGERSASHALEIPNLQELHEGPPAQVSPSLWCIGAKPDSSESSKEVDHSSPVSVLGAPFTEDASSSESFERVSAELHELRIQLQLLKMESGTCAEISPHVPVKEEVAMQVSPIFSEGSYNNLEGEGWEISYALDLLIDSGFEEESGFNMFRTTWHSPLCPLAPKLFENLEKKYGDATTVARPERRLLFDRINSCIVEIFEEHIDSCPWVMPKLAGSEPTMQREGIIDAIEKLIKQGFENEEITEKVLDKEMQWSFSKGEIEVIGEEIEKLLIDDMIAEIAV